MDSTLCLCFPIQYTCSYQVNKPIIEVLDVLIEISSTHIVLGITFVKFETFPGGRGWMAGLSKNKAQLSSYACLEAWAEHGNNLKNKILRSISQFMFSI